ncbi:MAG: hypothetical protein U0X75_04345 [Acidobacteriota bacterium]
MRSILNAYPLPNAPRVAADGDPADSERYVDGLSYPSRMTSVGVRFDHKFEKLDRLTVFGRFNIAPSEQFFRSFPSQENQFRKDTQTFTGGLTWTLSPRGQRFAIELQHGSRRFRFCRRASGWRGVAA